MSIDVVLAIFVTSIATYSSRFFGMITSEKIDENSKIYSLKGLSLVMKSECYNAKSEVLFSCYPHNNNLISQIAIAFEKEASNPKQAAIFFNKYIVSIFKYNISLRNF